MISLTEEPAILVSLQMMLRVRKIFASSLQVSGNLKILSAAPDRSQTATRHPHSQQTPDLNIWPVVDWRLSLQYYSFEHKEAKHQASLPWRRSSPGIRCFSPCSMRRTVPIFAHSSVLSPGALVPAHYGFAKE